MLRVAYLFERFPSFGQTFCYREVAELVRQGAEVAVFSIRRPKGEPAEEWDREIVARVTYLPGEETLVKEVDRAARRGQMPVEAVRSLHEWGKQSDFLRLYQAVYVGLRLQEAGISHVHAHFAGMAARTAYWLRKFFAIDFSVTAHANDIFAPREFVISLDTIFDAATAIVTVSDFAVAELQKRFPQSAAKVHRVYNGIDVERFPTAKFEALVPTIVSVGRLIEKKGFTDLISACAIMKARDVRFRCAIIGEGPMRDLLARQIETATLASEVELLGPRSQREIAERLAGANLFALPCTKEADGGMDNLPTVIMEAMAAGLPVVSTPLAGVPEMVLPGVTGTLVPQRDPQALASAVEQLLAERHEAQQLGARGRALAAEKFSLKANVRELAAILARNG
jgi:glycosyltransferase involved in cell wall biosynthesis